MVLLIQHMHSIDYNTTHFKPINTPTVATKLTFLLTVTFVTRQKIYYTFSLNVTEYKTFGNTTN